MPCCVGGCLIAQDAARLQVTYMLCGLVVSAPAFGAAVPSANLGIFSYFKSRNVNHENVQDICSVRKEGDAAG